MTTLMAPVDRRLGFVQEEVAGLTTVSDSQEVKETLQLCLETLKTMNHKVDQSHQVLRGLLSRGVESKMFVRDFAPNLSATEDILRKLKGFEGQLKQMKGDAFSRLAVQLEDFSKKLQAYRDLLADALAKASRPPHPVDPNRIHASEEAFERGETKPLKLR